MRIRVLQLVPSLGPGGYERVVCNICRNIDRRHFEIAVCCIKHIGLLGQDLKDEGFSIFLLPYKKNIKKYFSHSYLGRVIKSHNFHILHTHGRFALQVGTLAKMYYRNLRLIQTFHYGNYADLTLHSILFEILYSRFADSLIAVSEIQRAQICKSFHLSPNRIKVTLNGVDPSPATINSNNFRSELNIPLGKRIIGCIGHLHKQKNYTAFLRIAKSLLDSQPNIHFVIIGHGPQKSYLENFADQLGILKHITFTGLRNDATQILKLFDVFLLTSIWEAMPMVLLEAMAASIPVVATDVGENSKIVVHGKTGFIVPINDIELPKLYITFLLNNIDILHQFGENSLNRYKKYFSSTIMAKNYEKHYRALMPNK